MVGRKFIEIPIAVKFYRRKNKIFQHFMFSKYKKYLDDRYFIYHKLISKVQSLALKDCIFLGRRGEEDRIVLEFEGEKKPDNFFFVLAEFVPPTSGCDFCKYKDGEELFFICVFQNNKSMSRILKSCRFFKEG